MKVRRILTLGGAMLIGVLVFVLDLIRTSVAFEMGALPYVRDVLVIIAFVLLYVFVEISDKPRNENPIRRLGGVLLMGVVLGVVTSLLTFVEGEGGFETKGGELIPLNFRVV